MLITPQDRIVFFGDSITDASRQKDDPHSLGIGYAARLGNYFRAELAAPELPVFNRGVNGNRVRNLLDRLDEDLLALEPTVVSILVGINEVGWHYNKNEPTPPELFREQYRTLLGRIRDTLSTQIILLEPFLLPTVAAQRPWREDLNSKIDQVREFAWEFGTELIPLDGLFAEAVTRAPALTWSTDGVHPTEAGHELITEAWLEKTRFSPEKTS